MEDCEDLNPYIADAAVINYEVLNMYVAAVCPL